MLPVVGWRSKERKHVAFAAGMVVTITRRCRLGKAEDDGEKIYKAANTYLFFSLQNIKTITNHKCINSFLSLLNIKAYHCQCRSKAWKEVEGA